jgi:geranylgeranylglycerol-phosphate geranylgeranyltransferase
VSVKLYYPRLSRILSDKIAAYIALVRPFTLVAPLFAGFFLTIASGGVSYITLARGVYVGLTLALAQACGQVVNQVVDRELDMLTKPYRPIPQGRVTVEEAMGLAWLLGVAAVGRAFTISLYFGLMTCLMLFFAVFYSLPPLSPRRVNPWLNHLWVSFSRSVVPVLAVMGANGWKYALLAFVWAFGWQGTKDIADAEGDRLFGIKTLANTYGVTALRVLSTVSLLLYFAVCAYMEMPIFMLLVPLGLYGLLKYTSPWRGENTVAWAVYYVGLGLITVLTALSELF